MNIYEEEIEKIKKEGKEFIGRDHGNWMKYMDYVISKICKPGLWMEFGVWTGSSIRHIAGLTNETIYGFDSFEGLPEEWNEHPIGVRGLGGNPPNIPNKNIILIKGLYENTLDHFMTEHLTDCAFVHIDCDLYSSTKTILSKLKKYLTEKTIIAFDDLLNYPDYKDHELKAWLEFVQDNNIEYEWIAHSANTISGSHTALIIKKVTN